MSTEIINERIKLRRFTSGDLSNVRKLFLNDDVMKYTSFRRPQTEEVIRTCLDDWTKEREDQLGVWAVEDAKSSEFIGWSMLKPVSETIAELGYMIIQDKWHEGFATQVAELLINHGLRTVNLAKIISKVDQDNDASSKVLQKVGFQQGKSDEEGLLIFEITA